jgi:hypothetical protein
VSQKLLIVIAQHEISLLRSQACTQTKANLSSALIIVFSKFNIAQRLHFFGTEPLLGTAFSTCVDKFLKKKLSIRPFIKND